MMSTYRLFAAVTLLASSLAAPAPVPQAEFNVAKTNTTNNTPEDSTLLALGDEGEIQKLGGPGGSEYNFLSWVPLGQDLVPKLSQEQTNGNSKLGTFDAPKLPRFLEGTAISQGFPWGGRTAQNTDYYHDTPNTGVTVHYDFTVSTMTIAPDGVEKQSIVINGQYPGPTIEANWGKEMVLSIRCDVY